MQEAFDQPHLIGYLVILAMILTLGWLYRVVKERQLRWEERKKLEQMLFAKYGKSGERRKEGR